MSTPKNYNELLIHEKFIYKLTAYTFLLIYLNIENRILNGLRRNWNMLQHKGIPLMGLALILLGSFPIFGCAALVPTTTTGVATSLATSAGAQAAYDEGLPPAGGTLNSKSRIFDFADVLVPHGLGLEKDKSLVFQVGNISAGRLAFKGRLETTSLTRFFLDSMTANGWEHLASFSYPQIVLFFSKIDKTCIIQIWETMIYSHIRIWVTPSRKLAAKK